MKNRMALLMVPLAVLSLTHSAHAADEGNLLGDGFLEIIKQGGPVMIIIMALSVVGLAFAFERMVALRRGVLVPKRALAELKSSFQAQDRGTTARILGENKGPVFRILQAGHERRHHGAREMERAMEAVGAHEVAKLRRPTRPLSVLATVEPLLVLLGTILGMISTFNMLNTTTSAERVEKLAPGIGQALYTTAAGLCVAIPFVILYHYLNGRVNRAAEEWSLVGTDLALAFDEPIEEEKGEAA